MIIALFAVISISYVPAFRDDIASTRNSYERFPDWQSSAFNYTYALIENGRLDDAYRMALEEKTFGSPPWVRGYFKG